MTAQTTDMATAIALADDLAIKFEMHANGCSREEAIRRMNERRDMAERVRLAYLEKFSHATIGQAARVRMVKRVRVCHCGARHDAGRVLAYECPGCRASYRSDTHPAYGVHRAPGMRSDFLCACGMRVQLSEAKAAELEARYDH